MMINSFRRWVSTFLRDFPLLFQSFCPFSFVSWSRERLKEHGLILVPIHLHWRVVKQKGVYRMHGNGYILRELPCIWSHITLKLDISAHSKGDKTLECGNHYNVCFITLHAKTESPVHVQPLAWLDWPDKDTVQLVEDGSDSRLHPAHPLGQVVESETRDINHNYLNWN